MVICVIGMLSMLKFCLWIRYSSRLSGFLNVLRNILSVLGGM